MINSTPQIERRTLRHEMRVAQTGDGNTVAGHIALFNSPSQEIFGYTELIAPGAFTRTLSDGHDIVCLINHDDNAPAGRLSNGTLRLQEDEQGLYFEDDLPATTRAADFKVSLERKDVTGCSFGFICRDQEWIDYPDGTCRRILKDIELIEVSVGVTFPAYLDTDSQLRSLPESMPIEVRSRLESLRAPKIEPWIDDYLIRLRIAEAE